MQYDVVIVGAGPAGLAAAIRSSSSRRNKAREVSVCVLEKGSEVGAHILSGAVFDPRALAELFPDWQALGAPLNAPVSEDRFLLLTGTASYKIPNFMLPACFTNHGNYVISLGSLCRWLGQQAESLGVEIFPGFAAAEVLYNADASVKGVATGDMGVGRDGKPTAAYQPGMELHARYTFLPKAAADISASSCRRGSGCAKAATRSSTASASRNCGKSGRAAPARAGDPYRRVAAGQRHLRRLVLLSPRGQPGGHRFRRPDWATATLT